MNHVECIVALHKIYFKWLIITQIYFEYKLQTMSGCMKCCILCTGCYSSVSPLQQLFQQVDANIEMQVYEFPVFTISVLSKQLHH